MCPVLGVIFKKTSEEEDQEIEDLEVGIGIESKDNFYIGSV